MKSTPGRPRRRRARDTAAEALTKLGPDYLRERVHAVFDQFVTAVLDAALGIRHVYAKDPTTQMWARVTDPDTITRFLNMPALAATDPVWIIHTQDLDARLLEALLAFQLDAPFDPDCFPELLRALVQHEATGELTALSHPELLARLRARCAARDAHEGNAGTPRPGQTDPRRVH